MLVDFLPLVALELWFLLWFPRHEKKDFAIDFSMQ
jgi:hypothetical protein